MTTGTMQVDLYVGETLRMVGQDGQPINITLLQKSGQRAKVAVQAPRDVKIERPKRQ